MSPFTELLGTTLQGVEGTVSTDDALEGKRAVGLYFSAVSQPATPMPRAVL